MEMANCRKCKRLFPRVLDPICEDCKKDEEATFDTVREFLRDNPKSTVGETSEATGVSTKKIFGYLREGRLEIAEGAGLNCLHCGISIKSGKLCKPCFDAASQKIKGMIAAHEPPPPIHAGPELQKAQMHTTRRRR
jgi:flagellar operon protein (TIGR03826 family)